MKTESALDAVLKQRYTFNTIKQADGQLAYTHIVLITFSLQLIYKT